MKIKKILTESKLVEEETADAQKVEDQLTQGKGAEEVLDVAKATTADIAAQVADGAAEQNVGVTKADALKVAKDVQEFVRNPYIDQKNKYYCAGKPGAIKSALQTCLDAALDNRDAGLGNDDYPNLILEGLAGFGKTSIVKSFCREHGIYLFECDAKSLDTATVSGIPYPSRDPKTGVTTQSPIGSRYWKPLEDNKYVVLFLDEVNRAPANIRGTLLSLSNNHTLPVYKEDEDGNITTSQFYPNILFTVFAMNPASDIFPDVDQLDPAEVSRNVFVIEADGNKKEFLAHVTKLYNAILANPRLEPRLHDKYEGQFNLAQAILTDANFSFEDETAVRDNFNTTYTSHHTVNYLNYRTMFLLLKTCDGTKTGFLNILKMSGMSRAVVSMFKSILGTYTDKPTTGNQVFNQQTSPTVAKVTAQEIAQAMADFAKILGN